MRSSIPWRNRFEGGEPRLYYIAAKAGSGKTETLARAYIAVLLRELMEREGNGSPTPLRELAAVTFTREAAREMRGRILSLLKKAACGEEKPLTDLAVALEEYGGVSGSIGDLKELCTRAVEEILTHYTSFSVGTLDQFFVQLFLALSPEPAATQELAILLSPEPLRNRVELLFEELFMRLGEQGNLLFNLAQGYRKKLNWDPLSALFADSLKAYNFFSPHPPRFRVCGKELSLATLEEGALFALLACREKGLADLRNSILSQIREIRENVPKESLTKSFGNLLRELEDARDPGRFKKLLETRELNQKILKQEGSAALPPSGKKVEESRNEALEKVVNYLELERLSGLFYRWILYRIVFSAYRMLFQEEGTILLSLLQQLLALAYEGDEGVQGIPPEFVLSRGSTLRYLFVDEFQDTSPLQWYLLRPIVSELLSGGKPGILFLVGDLRQSLYSFRGSDWKLMAALKPEAGRGTPFPSAQGIVKEPKENYRSLPEILAFVGEVFNEENLNRFLDACESRSSKGKGKKHTSSLTPYILEALRTAGLTEVEQEPAPPEKKNHPFKGLVEVYRYLEEGEDPGEASEEGENHEGNDAEGLQTPLGKLLTEILHYLLEIEGRSPGEIAILCERNQEVVALSSLLLELARAQRFSVPFSVLSFSTLDLRKHPLVEELYLLLRYLYDDPVRPLYDGHLGRFLFGEIFTRFFLRSEKAKQSPGTSPPETPEELRLMLRRIFSPSEKDRAPPQEQLGGSYTHRLRKYFPALWEEHFESLRIRRGFLSLYELVVEIYRTFQVFPNFSQDEEGQGVAPFLEFLEKVHQFELQEGTNCERFFRSFEEGSEEEWKVEGIRSPHAISVLTIHKAKGKGFPVVISVHPSHGSREEQGFPNAYLLQWEGDPSGTSFLGDPQRPWVTEIIPILPEQPREYKEEWQKAFLAKKARKYLDLLTRFYVAFTRSEEELFILCGIPEKGTRKPYASFLLGDPVGREGEQEKPYSLLFRRGERSTAGTPTKAPQHGPSEEPRELSSLFSFRTLKLPAAHTSPETLFGVRLHECLTLYRYSDPKSTELFRDALQKWSLKEEEIARILAVLNDGIVQGFCDPSSLLEEYCEYEIADEAGNLHRLDRVLLYPDRVLVLDFKSGTSKEEDLLQVQGYKRLLSSLYPEKRVEGYLLYLFERGSWLQVP